MMQAPFGTSQLGASRSGFWRGSQLTQLPPTSTRWFTRTTWVGSQAAPFCAQFIELTKRCGNEEATHRTGQPFSWTSSKDSPRSDSWLCGWSCITKDGLLNGCSPWKPCTLTRAKRCNGKAKPTGLNQNPKASGQVAEPRPPCFSASRMS